MSNLRRIGLLALACAHLGAVVAPCAPTSDGVGAEPVDGGPAAMAHDHGASHPAHAAAEPAESEAIPPCHAAPPPPEWRPVCPCGCDDAAPGRTASHGLERAVFPAGLVVPVPHRHVWNPVAPHPPASREIAPPGRVPILA